MAHREFLFRGKEEPFGNWVEGFLVDESHIGDWTQSLPVDPETVGQFTGEAANGAQLFEGDIFRYDDELMVVEWSVPDSGYVARSLDGSNWEYPLGQIHLGCAEIVGNIHDNPELLEDQA